MMAFVKADLKREKEELNKLAAESEEARKAHEEFQARIAKRSELAKLADSFLNSNIRI